MSGLHFLIGLAALDLMVVEGQEPSPQVTPSVALTEERLAKLAISAPKPEYPIEARRRHLTGRGIFQLNLSESTGQVLSVEILTSTGHPILDRAAVKALELWKFPPHMFSRVKTPITFTITKHGDGENE